MKRRFILAFSLFLAMAWPLTGIVAYTATNGSGSFAPRGGARANVHLLTYEGIINPVSSELFITAITNAEKAGAEAIIIQLDTPGGLDTSMRDIIKAIIASDVPVIVHVYPSGGRAASAGAFIALAAHLSAMSPSTNIGAAHPVAMGGEKMDDTTTKKVENDAAAYIRSIAEQRGRDPKWAEDAVRKSVSATESEALALKIIDLIAKDVTGLLKQIDGRTVTLKNKTVVLSTASAQIIKTEIGLRHKLLKAISDPNVAYILMMLGTTGLIAELYSPGLIFPGVLGAISLILAFYSFQTLPVNYAGLALIVLSIILFVAEVMVQGFGVLAIGGITALLFGSLMLFDSSLPAFHLSLPVILLTVIPIAIFFLFLIQVVRRSLSGASVAYAGGGMVGQTVMATTDLNPTGTVLIHGELWQATAQETILAGESAEVTRMSGLTLSVKKGET